MTQALDELTAGRNAWLELDLDALAANVGVLRKVLEPQVALIGVVKANAYGHGAVGIGLECERLGVERLAVAAVGEGVALRRAGILAPIIVLGHAFPSDAVAAIEWDLTLTCHSLALGQALAAAAGERGRTARVHIKVDSGLHRFGTSGDDVVGLAVALRELDGLEVEGLATHMANADEPDDSFSVEQARVFAKAAAALPWIRFRHAANSATAARRPELRYEAVRCGLALYGVAPPNTQLVGLRPVLSLRARVARVIDLEPGEGVSYGLEWRASRSSRVALVPVGYADGWRRAFGNGGSVTLRGARCPIAGRIAMDQFLVDATAAGAVSEGDVVTLIGEQDRLRTTADDVAAWGRTISWEVLAGLGGRAARVYLRGGLPVRVDEPWPGGVHTYPAGT